MTAARDLVIRTTTPREKVYEKHLCIFTKNSLIESSVYHFERFQEIPPLKYHTRKVQSSKEKKSMKTKAAMKKKTYKDNNNNAMLCISWFKNLISNAGYWISSPAMTSVLEKKGCCAYIIEWFEDQIIRSLVGGNNIFANSRKTFWAHLKVDIDIQTSHDRKQLSSNRLHKTNLINPLEKQVDKN